MIEIKDWYKSKTVWFSVLTTLAGLLIMLSEYFAVGDFSLPALFLMLAGVVNLVLRIWFTDSPVA